MSTISLPFIFPNRTHPNDVLIAEGVPGGPVRRPSRSMLEKTSAPNNKSTRAGVLNSGSANFKSERCSHFSASGIGSSGRSFVILFGTYASTSIFSASSSRPEIWNQTDPRVFVVVPPIPCTNIFFLFRFRRSCCASRSCIKERSG